MGDGLSLEVVGATLAEEDGIYILNGRVDGELEDGGTIATVRSLRLLGIGTRFVEVLSVEAIVFVIADGGIHIAYVAVFITSDGDLLAECLGTATIFEFDCHGDGVGTTVRIGDRGGLEIVIGQHTAVAKIPCSLVAGFERRVLVDAIFGYTT